MKDMGCARKILGIDMLRNREKGEVMLSHSKYLQKVLEKYGTSEAKAVKTPVAAHIDLNYVQSPQNEAERNKWRKYHMPTW